MDAATLVQAAKTAGAKYGYDSVEVEVAPLADFKLRWKRSYKWIEFTVSDYLLEISNADAEEFFENIFQRIKGIATGPSYPAGVIKALTAPEFAEKYARVFIGRHRSMRPDDGRVQAIYDRLAAKGLTEGQKPILAISSRSAFAPGESSILMKVVALNEKILGEDEEVQEIALHTLLWHQAHMVFGDENHNLWEDLHAKMGLEYLAPLLEAGYRF